MNKKSIIKASKKCAYCGTTNNLTVDHILPKSFLIALGIDPNRRENTQVLCRKCNTTKGNEIRTNCERTQALVRWAFQHWLTLHGKPTSNRRQYVFRNLKVKSLSPEKTIFVSNKKHLESIYQRQTSYAKTHPYSDLEQISPGDVLQ